MKPLSALKFITGNPKKTLPAIISLTIGVFLVYFYSLIVVTTVDTCYETNINILKNYTMVYTNNSEELPQAFLDGLKDCRDAGSEIPAYEKGWLRYKNGLASSSTYVYCLFSEDTEGFLKGIDMKIVSGRLPAQGKNEILLTSKYAAQQGLKAGDYIGSAVSDSYGNLRGKYCICGIMEGHSIFAVTCNIDDGMTREILSKRSFFFNVKDHDSAEIKALEEKLPTTAATADYKTIKDYLNSELSAMYMARDFITALMVIVLCIALSNLNSITFSNRRGEFAVLHAMGYKKSRLIRKLWGESAVSCFAGYAAGILFTMLVGELLNLTIYHMQGRELSLFSGSGMAIALIIPFAVSFISLLPCLTNKFSIEEAQGA